MKALLVCILPAIFAVTGCTNPCRHGWRFEVFKPSIVESNAIVNQTTGTNSIAPLAAYPAQPVGRPGGSLAYLPEADAPAPRPTLAARSSCTMDDLCEGMNRIERLLSRQAASLPMPKAKD